MEGVYLFKRLKGLVFVSIFLCLFLCALAEAMDLVQTDSPKVRLSILPGRSTTGTIKVINRSAETVHIKVYPQDWLYLPAGDGTKEFKPAGTTEFSAADWISFSPAEFDIPPVGSQFVNYTVKVPPEARGGHYAVLFFEQYLGRPEEGAAQRGVNVYVAVRVASLFYIEPEGTIKCEAKLNKLSLKREAKDDPLEISAEFVNTGNVDITATGTFYIIDKKGMVYARDKFNQVYTLPGNTARLYASCKESIPQGLYDLVITLEIGKGLTIVEEVEIEFASSGEILRFKVKE